MTGSTTLPMYAEFCVPLQMGSLDQRVRSNDDSILTTSSHEVCCQTFEQLAVSFGLYGLPAVMATAMALPQCHVCSQP